MIDQDAIIMESIWTPLKKYDKDGKLIQIVDIESNVRKHMEVSKPIKEGCRSDAIN